MMRDKSLDIFKRPSRRQVLPAIGQTILNGDEEYVDVEKGWAYVTARITDLTGTGSQYLFDLSAGGSNPSISIRALEATDDMSLRYRHDSGNLQSGSQGGNRIIPNVYRTFGLIWNNKKGYIKLVSGGLVKKYSFTPGTFATPLTHLNIGSRISGLDPVIGDVQVYEFGSGHITPQELGRKMRGSAYTIVTAGQSLAHQYFKSGASPSDDGYAAVIETLGAFDSFADREIIFANGATGGSSIDQRSNADDYWWDYIADSPGPCLLHFLQVLKNTSLYADAVIWDHGQADSHYVGRVGHISRSQMKETWQKIFQYIRDHHNANIQIFVQKIGKYDAYSNTGGMQTVREVQAELIAENSFVHWGCETYDQDLLDGTHLVDAGYANCGTRMARRIAEYVGETVTGSTTGPEIQAVSRDGVTVTVTIAHDGGTDFTPATGIDGFVFHDDGAEIAITSAVRTNATTITLTLANAPMGAGVLHYGHDAMIGINAANILRDNSPQAMPLQTTSFNI